MQPSLPVARTWFADPVVDLSPALGLLIVGVLAIVLAVGLALLDWRRRHDAGSLRSNLSFILLMPIATVLGLGAWGYAMLLVEHFHWLRLVLGFTAPGVVLGYLIAHTSRAIALQSERAGVAAHLGHLGHLLMLLLYVLLLWGFLVGPVVQGLGRAVWLSAIGLAWILAPLFLRKLAAE